MKNTIITVMVLALFALAGCSENYSNGERIGAVTQFSQTGILWKSWEGHLNVTQTGMNSSVPFDFSIDNDNPDPQVINLLDSAAQNGWKIKLIYHETMGWNWFHNRGNTNHFVTKVEVLEKNFGNVFNGKGANQNTGSVIDTIYVVIDNRK